MNSLWIFHLWARPLPSIYYEFTILFANQVSIYCFAKTLWIPYLLREFTMNLLRVSRFTMNSLSFSQNNYKLTICFAILIRIHLMFPAFTMNSVGVSRIYFQFTIYFALYFANQLWIYYLFHEFTVFIANLIRILRVFREYTSYSLKL